MVKLCIIVHVLLKLHNSSQNNPAQRMEQQQNLQHHKETRSDPECWAQ